MAWKIRLDEKAEKQLDKLDRHIAERILAFLNKRLAPLDDPRSIGSDLKGSRLGEFWRYRVGDYRIVCRIENEELLVLVVRIGHRRDIYKNRR